MSVFVQERGRRTGRYRPGYGVRLRRVSSYGNFYDTELVRCDYSRKKNQQELDSKLHAAIDCTPNSDGLAKLSTRLLKLLPSEDRGGLRIARRTATLTTIATELIELLLV